MKDVSVSIDYETDHESKSLTHSSIPKTRCKAVTACWARRHRARHQTQRSRQRSSWSTTTPEPRRHGYQPSRLSNRNRRKASSSRRREQAWTQRGVRWQGPARNRYPVSLVRETCPSWRGSSYRCPWQYREGPELRLRGTRTLDSYCWGCDRVYRRRSQCKGRSKSRWRFE